MTARSVVMNASIVASSGAIIPLPLAKAAIVASTPPTVIGAARELHARVGRHHRLRGELDGAAARRGELRRRGDELLHRAAARR